MRLMHLIYVCIASTGIAAFQPACKQELPPEVVESAYVAETMNCVRTSTSKAESVACRAKVNVKFGLCPNSNPSIPCPSGDPQ